MPSYLTLEYVFEPHVCEKRSIEIYFLFRQKVISATVQQNRAKSSIIHVTSTQFIMKAHNRKNKSYYIHKQNTLKNYSLL